MPSGGANKFTYEFVKKYFEDHGCELLEETYERSVIPLKYRCSCGNVSQMDFGNFRKGRRCQQCKGRSNSRKFRTSNEDISRLCEQHGCQFVRSWIKCKKTRIEFICKCGEPWEAYLTNFKKCPNCKKCGAAKISGENCYMYDPDREAVALRKRFRKTCGRMIHRFMKATEKTKTKSTHELLGYTPMELQEHITNHPQYKSCIDGKWHVDHYFPIKAFLDHGIHDLRLINHLSNLRPMPGKRNLSKADKYDEKEFEQWLQKNCHMKNAQTIHLNQRKMTHILTPQ